ncbi:MAG: hypothetical protein IJH92_09800 [Mogibacterium sp.]|nr:hypothetical protein [Mogibacterium sp.]
MIKKYRIMTNKLLRELTDMQNAEMAKYSYLKKYENVLMRKNTRSNGREYYYTYTWDKDDKKRNSEYLGNAANKKVCEIKEAHYIKKLLPIIAKNISILRCVEKGLKEVDYAAINDLLPEVYQNTERIDAMKRHKLAAEWKRNAEAVKAKYITIFPEELRHKTDDGTMVRSKSEVIIYNLLLRMGVTFVYELPLRTSNKTFYPDFTILSEVDYKSVILIEHQGMMEKEEYRERFTNRVYDYLCAGYVQGINIFYTFDKIDGGVDTDPVLDIIRLKVRPES